MEMCYWSFVEFFFSFSHSTWTCPPNGISRHGPRCLASGGPWWLLILIDTYQGYALRIWIVSMHLKYVHCHVHCTHVISCRKHRNGCGGRTSARKDLLLCRNATGIYHCQSWLSHSHQLVDSHCSAVLMLLKKWVALVGPHNNQHIS